MKKNEISWHREQNGRLNLYLDGKRLDPAKSQRVYNHSPDGFNVGYGGSGPAQSALAILLEVTDRETALCYYQTFKWQFLADEGLDINNFAIHVDLLVWLKKQAYAGERNKSCAKHF